MQVLHVAAAFSRRQPLLAANATLSLHVELGARMVPFAGYEMPLHYPNGHPQGAPATRAGAGPVRCLAYGPAGAACTPRRASADAALALERWSPWILLALADGPPALWLFTNRQWRHSRRSHGGQSRRPSLHGRQCGVQGGGRGVSARGAVRASVRSSVWTAARYRPCKGRRLKPCWRSSRPRSAACASWMCAATDLARRCLRRFALRLHRRGRI